MSTQDGLKRMRITAPVDAEQLKALEIGDVVYLNGVIYTGREGLYRRVITEGMAPPEGLFDLTNVIFHCSPAAAVNDDGSYTVGAVTATASFRFSHVLADWFRQSGCRMILGKGGMSEADYREHFVPNGAVYLTTVGYGTGALLGRGIRRVRDVHWLEELGIAQAIWVFEVENFGPFLVESNLAGDSLFERENRTINKNIERVYDGLKAPSLKRYGEITSREDEVI